MNHGKLEVVKQEMARVNVDILVIRKLTNLIMWTTALSNSVKLWPCRVGPPRTDGSWWRVLTKCGPLEKGMANHFSILALRTP